MRVRSRFDREGFINRRRQRLHPILCPCHYTSLVWKYDDPSVAREAFEFLHGLDALYVAQPNNTMHGERPLAHPCETKRRNDHLISEIEYPPLYFGSALSR